jgi:succinate dehydrogenase/fumarate reductase cytochrome b subunit
MWRRAHRCNAVLLSVFILLHMITHLSGLFGIETYNDVQSLFRVLYRNTVVEVILIASVTVQLGIGLHLLIKRIRSGGNRGFWPILQIASGAVFFVFMAQHLYSLGMARLYFDLDTNFYWPASVMSGPWFVYYFTPYYVLGVFAIFAHIGAGFRFVMLDRGNRRLGQTVGVSFLVAGAAVSLVIPAVIGGLFFPIELPQQWIDYLRFYDPDFRPW